MYLNCHSWYSLRYGTLSIEALVEEAKQKGIYTMALTDINNTSGSLEFVRACEGAGIRPVIGIEFREGNKLLYTALAKNPAGFQQLNAFLSACNFENRPVSNRADPFPDAVVIYPFGTPLQQLQAQEYIGVRPSEVSKLPFSPYKDDWSRLVIIHPVTFQDKQGHELHRNLRAIDNNLVLSDLKPEHLAQPDEIMLSPDKLLSHYRDYPQIIRNTEALLASCSFNFDFKKLRNKKIFTSSAKADRALLEKLTLEGVEYRYGKNNQTAFMRVKHELEIIEKLGFCAYFLITWDIIRYSMSQGFYHVGRGSGANSVVAYCLRITDVDPIDLNLQFERFLNPKRTSPPDFDIDYSHDERPHVQDYIFKRYGQDHTALLGTMNTFKQDAIIRELGKVYGLPKHEIDALVDRPEGLQAPGKITAAIRSIGSMMKDFPNYRSVHAGGILISEEPITAYTALDLPPVGFPVVQWDMYLSESIGFEKFDILSQRGIGHIRDAVELVQENRREKVDAHDIARFKKDKKVRQLLNNGDTIGCFYVESPAMRGLLKKLRCEDYLTLVAASSIIRPGVASSGMMRAYIYNFHHPEKVQYIHPVMREQLEETYGVMVYQEDVLTVCHHFGGLDLSDADLLRRTMSGKGSRKVFAQLHDKFFSNCQAKGYPEEVTKEVWRQIESFGGYSFAKGHSASFAVESYQSMYLKAHYPLEFMVGVINNFGGFYRTWVYVNEARKLGATIHLPCVNRSKHMTTITGTDIYLGFVHVQGLESKLARQIQEEREEGGPYLELENFVRRTRITAEQLRLLVSLDAFRFTGRTKKQVLWQALAMLKEKPEPITVTELFEAPAEVGPPGNLEYLDHENAYDEIRLLGFPVTSSYFDLLKTKARCPLRAKELVQHIGSIVRIMGNYVTYKHVRTKNGKDMAFGTFLDEDGNFFDTTHFPPVFKQTPFTGPGIYLIKGRVVEEFGFPSIEVERMEKLEFKSR